MTEYAHTHTHGSQWESSGDLADRGLQGPSFPAHFAGKSASPAACLANVLFFSCFFCILVWSVFNL